jgi:chemotaxis protein methyltransferase CheR
MKEKQETDFKRAVSLINRVTDFNLYHYKIKPLRRRIHSRMRRLGINSYEDYTNYLITNRDEINILENALTINLTRFFRNMTVFDFIRDEIIPSLDNPFIWSAGCANGAEAYSISILCQELNKKYSIIGTDIDKESIRKAREGAFDNFAMQEVGEYILNKYFEKSENFFKVKKEVRKNVTFHYLDLKDIDFINKFDLIICRNVLIYLSKEFQEQTLLSFYKALKSNGYLILGKVETIVGKTKKLFHQISLANRIYQKK